MSDAEAFATNLKVELQARYPDDWLIEVAASDNEARIRVLVQDAGTNKRHRQDYPVEGFHVQRVLDAIYIDFPPPR